jgi:toxin ParE1/3/4
VKLQWGLKARADLDEIETYIAARSPKGAARVWTRITDRVATLVDSPYAGRPSQIPGLRELVVTQTPYIVFYEIVEDAVRIRYILHGRQNR